MFSSDSANSYSYGNVLAFKEATASTSPNQPTFSVTVSSSDRVPPNCVSVNAVFEFICDAVEGRGHPVLAAGTQDVCHPVFTWRSILACRLCNSSEVTEERSACVGNSRVLLYRPKNSDCVLGLNYSESLTESCRALEVDETIGGGIAAAVIILVIILAVIAFIFWRRKREVETKYERLMSDAPLDELDGHVDLDD